jgi:ADP-ribosylglycohydrolase
LILWSLIESNTNQQAPNNVSVFQHASGVRVDVGDFARRLVKWLREGHAEHKHPGGLGCGATTFQTMRRPNFRTDPVRAASDVWIASGRKAAPNGSVMRISTSGCFGFWDESLVLFVADLYGRATHADPRCVFCARAAALIISRLLQVRCGLIEPFDLDATLQYVLANVEGAAKHRDDIMKNVTAKTLQELELSGNKCIGYCLKCLGSAVWALRYATSFDEGIAAVVREAGDADTNGSVVGAFLGAKFGFGAIGKEFIDHLFVGQWLWREVAAYLELMGLSAPPSPYLGQIQAGK